MSPEKAAQIERRKREVNEACWMVYKKLRVGEEVILPEHLIHGVRKRLKGMLRGGGHPPELIDKLHTGRK